MNSEKTRISLIGIVGGYLIYLAYQLFEGWNDPDTTMSHPVMVLFISLFGIIGIVLLVYAFRRWKQSDREDAEKKRPEDEDALK